MTTNNPTKPDAFYTESPVSWNTRYVSPDGFECQLTLRGETGQEVLEKATAAITHLLKVGCHPAVSNKSFSRSSKPSTGGEKSNNSSSTDKEQGTANPDSQSNTWCTIHHCEMKRWEKDGRVWYSHKINGAWCIGKEK
jgi:hypothetical protein